MKKGKKKYTPQKRKIRNTPQKNRGHKKRLKVNSKEPVGKGRRRFLLSLSSFFKKHGKVFKIIGVIITIIPTAIIIYDTFLKSDYIKFEENNIRKGSVRFSPMSKSENRENEEVMREGHIDNKYFYYDSNTYHYPIVKGIYVKGLDKMAPNDDIFFVVGRMSFGYSKKRLEDGINILSTVNCGDTSNKIWAVAIKNRIYISAKFMDLRTDNEIGEMQFNHWTVYLNQLIDYHYDDDKFEVLDKQGNIVFSIADISSGSHVRIAVSGYFNTPFLVTVFAKSGNLSDICISKSDSNWLKKAEAEISDIHSVFPNRSK
ncbi:MAG TPA: hypothetical protein VIJ75_07410 [Hanamia sp.]